MIAKYFRRRVFSNKKANSQYSLL